MIGSLSTLEQDFEIENEKYLKIAFFEDSNFERFNFKLTILLPATIGSGHIFCSSDILSKIVILSQFQLKRDCCRLNLVDTRVKKLYVPLSGLYLPNLSHITSVLLSTDIMKSS